MHTPKTPLTKTHSLDLGECIGMESGIDLISDIDILDDLSCKKQIYQFRKKEKKEKKNYPPPLPKHPWVMKRHYIDDGRLIITEEKVERHEYFQAHRSNGRLVLRLVPLNDTVLIHNHVEEEVEEEDNGGGGGVGGGDDDDDNEVNDEAAVKKKQEFGVGNKCYQYDTVSNSTMFSMGVQAIRPVHI